MAHEFVVEWEMRREIREQFRQAQRAHMEVTEIRTRLVKDIAESHELMAHADFVLTLPFLLRPSR